MKASTLINENSNDQNKITIPSKHIKVPPLKKAAPGSAKITDVNPTPESNLTPAVKPADKIIRLGSADWTSFPDQPSTAGSSPPMTIANLKHLLSTAGIIVRYNIVKKKTEIVVPGLKGTGENYDNVALAHVISLAAKCGLSTGQVGYFVAALADANAYNPVADWINGKEWDGKDRLPAFYNTLTETDDYPHELKCTLMRKWLLSAAAAALMASGFRNRGVITLQGAQGLGKTRWTASLVSDPVLRASVVKLDHHLDPHNKDSILGATAHFIVEIGELDSSLKKEVARIKGVLTADSDKVRVPYARLPSEYPRRTVFVATVNQSAFLTDDTGNSRWWTIPVTAIDYEHGIDMQQLFAQLACDFRNGAEWWLDPEEEKLLEQQNRHHRTASAIAEQLMSFIDLDRISDDGLPAMTPTELLIELGYTHPTNPQCKECAAFLRERLGEPKRIQGQNKWRVPVKAQQGRFGESQEDPDFDKFA